MANQICSKIDPNESHCCRRRILQYKSPQMRANYITLTIVLVSLFTFAIAANSEKPKWQWRFEPAQTASSDHEPLVHLADHHGGGGGGGGGLREAGQHQRLYKDQLSAVGRQQEALQQARLSDLVSAANQQQQLQQPRQHLLPVAPRALHFRLANQQD